MDEETEEKIFSLLIDIQTTELVRASVEIESMNNSRDTLVAREKGDRKQIEAIMKREEESLRTASNIIGGLMTDLTKRLRELNIAKTEKLKREREIKKIHKKFRPLMGYT